MAHRNEQTRVMTDTQFFPSAAEHELEARWQEWRSTMPKYSELEDYDDLDYERYWQKYGGGEDVPSDAWSPRQRRVQASVQASVHDE